MGVIDSTTQINFAGSGVGLERVEPMMTTTIVEFLGWARRHHCGKPDPVAGTALQSK